MSSRDLPISATPLLGSQAWSTALGFSVSTGDLNSGPFTHPAISLAVETDLLHRKNETMSVSELEKWLSS